MSQFTNPIESFDRGCRGQTAELRVDQPSIR